MLEPQRAFQINLELSYCRILCRLPNLEACIVGRAEYIYAIYNA
jgi:hypothetical protein